MTNSQGTCRELRLAEQRDQDKEVCFDEDFRNRVEKEQQLKQGGLNRGLRAG